MELRARFKGFREQRRKSSERKAEINQIQTGLTQLHDQLQSLAKQKHEVEMSFSRAATHFRPSDRENYEKLKKEKDRQLAELTEKIASVQNGLRNAIARLESLGVSPPKRK